MNVTVTTKPRSPHRNHAKVLGWDKAYFDSNSTLDDVRRRASAPTRYFYADSHLIGYARVRMDAHQPVAHVTWFCAPRNGAACMAALVQDVTGTPCNAEAVTLNVMIEASRSTMHTALISKRTAAIMQCYTRCGFDVAGVSQVGYGAIALRMRLDVK